VHDRKTYGRLVVVPPIFNSRTRRRWVVSCIGLPLCRRQSLQYPSNRAGWIQSRSGRFEEKNLLLLPGIKPQFLGCLARSLITALTAVKLKAKEKFHYNGISRNVAFLPRWITTHDLRPPNEVAPICYCWLYGVAASSRGTFFLTRSLKIFQLLEKLKFTNHSILVWQACSLSFWTRKLDSKISI
jgi:hypothetical protein